LTGGSLAVGGPADIVVFDPGRRWTVRADDLHSKSANSPYLGEILTGQADLTVVGGRIVFERGVAKADA
jgi:dihydroorotase